LNAKKILDGSKEAILMKRNQDWLKLARRMLVIVFVQGLLISSCNGPAAAPITQATPPGDLFSLCWVAYTPTNYDPNNGIYPPEASIRQDLQTLHDKGFAGLVTYGADGTLGGITPGLAQELGFKLIMGIWDPNSAIERKNAVAAAAYPSTVGYVIGNEGLGKRYELPALRTAMDSLRQTTGKPVTTTEEFGDYTDTTLLNLGDWIFPTVHPFYAGITDPTQAAAWTKQVFDDFRNRTNRPVLFKEVGLPTNGDPQKRLDENSQAEYYQRLRNTDVKFVYFEAFDQPWKTTNSVEPYWGLFKPDRTPKQAVNYVCNHVSPAPTPASTATLLPAATPTMLASTPEVTTIASSTALNPNVFNVYSDASISSNHFIPSGFMGDTGDITVNQAWLDNPHSGTQSIKLEYAPLGKGPNTCPYAAPCKWAGVYWQNPANNWGTVPNAGLDLRGYSKLTFWARSDSQVRLEFKVGGITGKYPDSLQPARGTGLVTLTSQWQPYQINLAGADLSYVIGGFEWSASWTDNAIGVDNPKTLVFYLDDIQFEK
jgi:exo-beta-1,3-glucanase (GH17 family)